MRRPAAVALGVVGLAVLVVAVLLVGVWVNRSSLTSGAECTVPATSGADPQVELTAAQLQHASSINAVGLARGLSERARIIAIATAYQESSLRNVPDGDRDSVGLFQQRPSQGWGDAAQIIDPVYASNRFYDALLEVPDWPDLPLTEAAQAVQYSAYPDAYAKWEPDATTLTRALSGAEPLALGCREDAAAPTADAPARPAVAGAEAANSALAAVLVAAQAEFGTLSLLAVEPDGATASVSVALPGTDAEPAARALAAWAVAHGAGFGVSVVQVGDRQWSEYEWSGAGAIEPGMVVIGT